MGLETGIDLSIGKIGGFAIYLAWIFGFIVLVVIAAIIIWYYNNKKQYKEEIVIFENISGQGWVVREKDMARRIRLSADGTETLFLKRNQMPLTAYGRKMGTNQYWYAIGSDGGWYNFVLGDLDTKMGVLDIELIDRDIKYIMVAMLKNAEKEYGPKQSFMDKWGTWIFSIIWLIIGIAGASYLISQMGGIANNLTLTSEKLGLAVEKIATVVGQLDIMSTGGSGLVSR
jgi:hypothetical protein